MKASPAFSRTGGSNDAADSTAFPWNPGTRATHASTRIEGTAPRMGDSSGFFSRTLSGLRETGKARGNGVGSVRLRGEQPLRVGELGIEAQRLAHGGERLVAAAELVEHARE